MRAGAQPGAATWWHSPLPFHMATPWMTSASQAPPKPAAMRGHSAPRRKVTVSAATVTASAAVAIAPDAADTTTATQPRPHAEAHAAGMLQRPQHHAPHAGPHLQQQQQLARPPVRPMQQQQQQQQQQLAGPPVRPMARPQRSPPAKPPASVKLFSDVDNLIQAYSNMQVTVVDTAPQTANAARAASASTGNAAQSNRGDSSSIADAAPSSTAAPEGPAAQPQPVTGGSKTSQDRTSSSSSSSSNGSRNGGDSSSSGGGASIAPLGSRSSSPASASPRTPPSPSPLPSFDALGSAPYRYSLQLRRRMAAAGYNLPTPIQRHAIPFIHAGRDVLAMAHTGTGKTAAYLVPLVGRLMKAQRCKLPRNTCYPAALVLLPTRELAQQVLDEMKVLTQATHLKAVMLAGGGAVVDQTMAMRGGADIVVATPGRLMDHVSRGTLRLRRVSMLVVDEADKMLDLGFEPELQRLLGDHQLQAAPLRQTVMLSATLPAAVRQLAGGLLNSHVLVQIGTEGGSVPLIDQRLELLPPAAKMERLLQLASQPPRLHTSPHIQQGLPGGQQPTGLGAPGTPSPAAYRPASPPLSGFSSPAGMTVVFTNSVATARKVHALLCSRGHPTSLLHGELPQAARDEAITCFKFGVTSILVATGVASRGLDIPDVGHVVNFDVPPEADEYVHRVGRTGRAGRCGVATTLFTPGDAAMAAPLAGVLRASGQAVPAWLETLLKQQGEAGEQGALGGQRGESKAAGGPSTGQGGKGGEQEDGVAGAVAAGTGQQGRKRPLGVRVSPGTGGKLQLRQSSVRDWHSSWNLGYGQYLPPSRPDLNLEKLLLLGGGDAAGGAAAAGRGRVVDGPAGGGPGAEAGRAASAELLARWQGAIYGRSKGAAGASGESSVVLAGGSTNSSSGSAGGRGVEGGGADSIGDYGRMGTGPAAGVSGAQRAQGARQVGEGSGGAGRQRREEAVGVREQQTVGATIRGAGRPRRGGSGRGMVYEDGRIQVTLGGRE